MDALFGQRGLGAADEGAEDEFTAARLRADAPSMANRFKDFLRDALPDERVLDMAESGERRFLVDLDSLRMFDSGMAAKLLHNAEILLPHFVLALNQHVGDVLSRSPGFKQTDAAVAAAAGVDVSAQQPTEGTGTRGRWSLGFTGSFAANHVNPRTLCSQHLWSLISVEGMVIKCSNIHPLLVRSVHYCPKTKSEYAMSFEDQSTTLGNATMRTQFFPTKDADGNPLEPEFGYFEYRDHQNAVVQEMPEHAPAGQLPRSVPVVLDDDLVDQVKPGDRVQVVGVYRAVPGAAFTRGGGGGILAFRTVLVATNVRKIMRDASAVVFSYQDIENIAAVSRLPDVYERMAASLAPSIFGHAAVKRALLLQLMGGQEKQTRSGIHLRGDIHLLLVGDPSTAKSQLLRFMLHVAPLAISTNARGASGVGLTAAIVADPDTHERALEAGAMVLADRGVVCIDEFDKMSVDDRAALHEVMEQQTVTIQKAGVHASLNARCSVFAAANPIYGSYNRERPVAQNIGFPATLLSRFDALFVILDPADAHRDRAIAEHVLRMHKEGRHVPLTVAASGAHSSGGVAGGDGSGAAIAAAAAAAAGGSFFGGTAVVDLEETVRLTTGANAGDGGEATPVFAAAAGVGAGAVTAERIAEVVETNANARFSVDFIRKYVSYARERSHPALTPEAGNVLVEAYSDFRQRARPQPGVPGGHQQATLPITARLLESMVRLSEAHARCRLAKTVTPEDAEAAVALVKFALYNEGTGSPAQQQQEQPLPQDGQQVQQQQEQQQQSQKQKRGAAATTRKKGKKRRRPDGEEGGSIEDTAAAVRERVNLLFRDFEMVTVEKVIDGVGKHHTRQQVEDALQAMSNEGQLLYADGMVYRT